MAEEELNPPLLGVHFPCFVFLASVFPMLLLVFHFSCGEKSLLLPSLAQPLYSHHFRPPLPTLGRSFPSPEGIHLTIKDTEWAWTGPYIPEMPAWPWNATELLRKGPKGLVLSQGLSAAPTLRSHKLTGFPPPRMFSVSQRIILTLKNALSFKLVVSKGIPMTFVICVHKQPPMSAFALCSAPTILLLLI